VISVGTTTYDVDDAVGSGLATFEGLDPFRRYPVLLDGTPMATATTLARPAGRLLARVATLSDLHIGERAFGLLPRLRSAPAVLGDDGAAHPMRCLRGAVDEICAWQPDLVVVKGDLAHRSRRHEYDLAVGELRRIGRPLLVTRGNHDGGNHRDIDAAGHLASLGVRLAAPVATHDLNGARIVAMDSVIDGERRGTAARDADLVVQALATHDGPCLLALHHQFMPLPFPHHLPVGIPRRESTTFLDAVARANPRTVVTSGHTHRNRARRHGPVLVTEVGSPKDYLGVWGAYEIYEGGIVQSVRRISMPDTLAWNDRTRRVALGAWGLWSPGRPSDRDISHRYAS
jgi:3',5'-cyclic AMP phosphodiesterase CpdA